MGPRAGLDGRKNLVPFGIFFLLSTCHSMYIHLLLLSLPPSFLQLISLLSETIIRIVYLLLFYYVDGMWCCLWMSSFMALTLVLFAWFVTID